MSENNSSLELINNGKKYMFNKDYNSAINVFMEGLNNSYDPIFNLYIGICYYKCNDYLNSIKYLENYKNEKEENLEVCYLFLSANYKNINDYKMCFYYYQKFLGNENIDISSKSANGIMSIYNNIINNKIENVYNLIMTN